MDVIVRALAAQHRELDELLLGLVDADWQRPSRCPGWTVCDVVLHLAQTDELVLASGDGRFADLIASFTDGGVGGLRDVDEAAALAVARERGPAGLAVFTRWRAAAAATRTLLAGCDPRRRLPWMLGALPARTLATTRLAETWIHTGDVTAALGRDLPATERLWHVARLAWRTLPYAFRRSGQALHGPVAVELIGADGSIWDFGRDTAPLTIVRGPALDFCLVGARRLDPAESSLVAEGPDAEAVLALLRTYA